MPTIAKKKKKVDKSCDEKTTLQQRPFYTEPQPGAHFYS